jgi:curved DNA-binding protein CbpA
MKNTMTQHDAAQLLNLTGKVHPKMIKKAYRKACNQYHPDKGGSTHMMQAINTAYNTLKNFTGTLEDSTGATSSDNQHSTEPQKNHSYPQELNEAINKIIDLPNIIIEIIGSWLWVTGDTYPHRQKLGKKPGGAGFTFCKKEGKPHWFFRPEDYKSTSRGGNTLDQIKDKFKTTLVTPKRQQRLAC